MPKYKIQTIHRFSVEGNEKGAVFMQGALLSATHEITIYTKYTDEFVAGKNVILAHISEYSIYGFPQLELDKIIRNF